MKFAFIADNLRDFPADVSGDVLGVSHSGYDAWRERPTNPTAERRGQLTEQNRHVHLES